MSINLRDLNTWQFIWRPPGSLSISICELTSSKQAVLAVPEADDLRRLFKQLQERFGDSAADRIVVEGGFSNGGGFWVTDTKGLLYKIEPDDDDPVVSKLKPRGKLD